MRRLMVVLFLLSLAGVIRGNPWVPIEKTDVYLPTPSVANPLEEYDVVQYDLKFDIVSIPGSIIGEAKITIVMTAYLVESVVFDACSLTIDSVLFHDAEADSQVSFTQDTASIRFALDRYYASGDTLVYDIFYSTTPTRGYFYRRAGRFGDLSTFTLSWPSNARYIFPCVDHPKDKAKSTIEVIAPEGEILASNGVLTETEYLPGATRYRWEENYPVCTYNICFASADFETIIDTSETGNIFSYYFPPSMAELVYDDLSVVEYVESLFIADFGEYPFDKFGQVLVALPTWIGGMEHQDIVFLSDSLITGMGHYKATFVHEFSHQWWGNAVGIADWRDFWLNEGMAVHSELLYHQFDRGDIYAREMRRRLVNDYIAYEEEEGIFPIYDPDVYLGYTVYYKGAMIIHMLRYTIGDSLFFELLHRYYEENRYSTVTTYDLIELVNDVTGEDMSWFFDEWVFDVGYPFFQYSAYQSSDTVYVDITQIQDHGPIFQTYLDIRISSTTSSEIHREFITERNTHLEYIFSDRMMSVTLDPNKEIIKSYRFVEPGVEEPQTSIPELSISVFPNPANPTVNIEVDARFPVDILIYNELGEIMEAVPDVVHETALDVSQYPSGIYLAIAEEGNRRAFSRFVVLR